MLPTLRNHPFFECEVSFQDHLPRNRTLELADINVELMSNLESLEGALKRMGVTDIEAKLEEIARGKEFLSKLTRRSAIIENPEVDLPEEDAEPEIEEVEDDGSENENESGGGEENNTEESPGSVEERTGQSAERTQAQRSMKGKGDL